MSGIVDFLHVVISILLDIHCSYKNMLFWAGLVRHGLSSNQIVRCFKLKKLENCVTYQVDFLLPLNLQKIWYFGLWPKILLANQFAEFSTFDLFDLLILMPGVHCCIVLILIFFSQKLACPKKKSRNVFRGYSIGVNWVKEVFKKDLLIWKCYYCFKYFFSMLFVFLYG